jgi:hypothetical protein
MALSYTNTKRKGSKPTLLQKLLKLTLYLAAVGMAIAAIATIVSFINAKDDALEEPAAFPFGTLSELIDPGVFMQAYLSVNCNAILLESTQTIRVGGVLESDDSKQVFTLIKKRPDRMLFKVNRGSLKITFGVSDDTVWRIIRSPQREDLITLIEGEEATQWLGQRRFFDRIISASLGDGTITGITTSAWDARTYLEVTTESAMGETVQILVDPQTMYPRVEVESMADGGIQRTVFSDYRKVQGMPIAFTMETTVEGILESRIILDSAALNAGVLTRLFEVPESLRAQSVP